MLDIIRIGSALVVAWGHLTLPAFSTGLTNRMQSAGAAVIVFFVLSGFVIRYVSLRTPGTFTSYTIDRASRIYSVLIPAVMLTGIVSLSFGYLPFGDLQNACAFALRILQTLLFTSWSWHQQVTLPSNGALWSISFECLFYLLYGACFYLRGRARILWLLLAAAWAGPEILTFFPVWLAGCLLYDLFFVLRQADTRKLAKTFVLSGISLLCLLCGFWHPLQRLHLWVVNRYHFLQFADGPSHGVMHLLWPRIGHGAPISINAYPEAAVYFLVFLTLLLVADRAPLTDHSLFRKLGSKLADATFPLYLLHLPLYCITVRLVGHPMRSNLAACLLLAAVLAISVLLAPAFNSLKTAARHLLRAFTTPST